MLRTYMYICLNRCPRALPWQRPASTIMMAKQVTHADQGSDSLTPLRLRASVTPNHRAFKVNSIIIVQLTASSIRYKRKVHF